MPETTTETAPPLRAPLLRSPDDRVLLGVCAAVGRSTGTDPVLWRVVLGVLAVFGGAGVALYLVGVLLIPREGEAASLAERAFGGAARTGPRAVAAVAVAAVLVLAVLDDARGLLTVSVVGAVAYLVHRERTGRPLVPSPPATPVMAYDPQLDRPYAAGPPPAWGSGTPWEHTAPVVARPPRSRLGAMTLGLAALAAGAVVLVQAYGDAGVVASDALTAALLVVSGGLVLGTCWGRARWLVPLGVLLAVALGVTTVAERLEAGGVGTRSWVVAPVTTGEQSFRLSAGEAVLDLRQVQQAAGAEPVRVRVRQGVGELVVLVPDGLTVHVDASVGVGELLAPGTGPDPDGSGLDSLVRVGQGEPDVVVDAALRVGALDVRAS